MNTSKTQNRFSIYRRYNTVSLYRLIVGTLLLCFTLIPGAGSGAYEINDNGFFTNYPLWLVADADKCCNEDQEDMMFGFHGASPSTATERMRLTRDGRLGIGTSKPETGLHVKYNRMIPGGIRSSGDHAIGENAYEHDGEYVGYKSGVAGVGRFSFSPLTYPDASLWANYYFSGDTEHAMEIVIGGSFYPYPLTNPQLTTVVGLDIGQEAWLTTESDDKDGNPSGILSKTGLGGSNHRAIGMHLMNGSEIKITVGHDAGYTPSETLDVNGAIRIRDTSTTHAGTIRFTSGSFEGYDGSKWLDLSAGPVGEDNIVIHGGHQLVFGSTADHRTPNNYLVNSMDVPDDNQAEFPIPSTGNTYNNDDAGTSGGMAMVAGGLPRFTVKGNGNTYVHKRLSIGVGGHVPGTVLTVAGAVHVGPDNVQPTIFNYKGEIADYLLWVEKGIVSEDFAIANVSNWSDYVLRDDYDLKPLAEVEDFIQKEGHLPGVPSAEDVKENGYTVHEMTRVLLEKVEELTLHTIAQQKVLEQQRAQIADLRMQLGEAGQSTPFVKTGY